MRGQSNVVATVLVVAIGIALAGSYYIFSQQLYGQTQTSLEKEIQKYHELAAQSLKISSATAKVDGPIAHFTVSVINSGDVPVSIYSNVTWYLYYNGIVYRKGVTSCPSPTIDPGAVCTIQFDVSSSPDLQTREDFYKTSVTVYLNEVPLSSTVDFIGSFPGTATYLDCYSCSDCSSKASSAEPGTILVMHLGSVSGDCVDVNGANGITLYCDGALSGDGTGIGIAIRNSSSVTIRSCEITGFKSAIYVENSPGVSLLSVYLHNNTDNLTVSPDTLYNTCQFGEISAATDHGPIYQLHNLDSSTQDVTSASAIWVISSKNSSISGNSITLQSISPAIAVCDSNSISITDFSTISGIGVYLVNDVGTHLDTLSVSSWVRGIVSENSSGGYICCSTFKSPEDIFFNPEGFEWDSNTLWTT